MAGDFVLALVAGVVAAVVWASFAWLRRHWRYRRTLRPSIGFYQVRAKGSGTPKTEKVSIVAVRQNIVDVRMTCIEPNGQGFAQTGIEMSEQFLRSGRGLYEHIHGGKPIAFGWWDIQIKDKDTIYVHTTFADGGTFRVEGAVWERITED